MLTYVRNTLWHKAEWNSYEYAVDFYNKMQVKILII